jgi:hypothetical protein
MSGDVATSQQTVEALLRASRRDALPLETSFVQQKAPNGKAQPGPLSTFVRVRRFVALQQYLLAHAAASGGDYSVARDSRVWARALDLDPRRPSSRATVSKNWAWLERQRLIARSRQGRRSRITVLRDDGSGLSSGGHPAKRGDRYFKLPYEYWIGEWHRRLDLASLAVLLIGLSLRGEFALPVRRVQEWYGISSTTLNKGLKGLRDQQLLEAKRIRRAAPLAPDGFTLENHYTLLAPFNVATGRAMASDDPSA